MEGCERGLEKFMVWKQKSGILMGERKFQKLNKFKEEKL